MQVNRRLSRCRQDRLIAGVASGVAEYFDIDPTIVRLLWILSVFFGGLGLFLYVAMAIIVPLEPEEVPAVGASANDPSGEASVPSPTGWHSTPAAHRHATGSTGRLVTFFGIALILFGALALLDAVLPAWADGGRFLWPAFVLGIGAILVVSAMRREPTEL
jgi:phage shock protein C